MKPAILCAQMIETAFEDRGLQLLEIEEQADDIHRLHFDIGGNRLILAIDEEALYVFTLDFCDVMVLDETRQEGVIRAALEAINNVQSRMHYVRFLLRAHPSEQTQLFMSMDGSRPSEHMAWLTNPLPRQRGTVTVNFSMPLLGNPPDEWIEAFEAGVAFLFEATNQLAQGLRGAGFQPVRPDTE